MMEGEFEEWGELNYLLKKFQIWVLTNINNMLLHRVIIEALLNKRVAIRNQKYNKGKVRIKSIRLANKIILNMWKINILWQLHQICKMYNKK